MAMLILTAEPMAEEGGCVEDKAHSDLQNGYIALGSADKQTGEAWYDTSYGPSYGNGRRFESEETAMMTKVRSKRRRNDDDFR